MELDLGNNQMKVLPWTVGKVTRLCKLNLADNQLEDLPYSLGDFHICFFFDNSILNG